MGKLGNGEEARGAQNIMGDGSNYTWEPDFGAKHAVYTTKYGSEVLQGMRTKISTVKNHTWKSTLHVEALADSGASASIISMTLAKKIKMTIYDKGDATFKDASNKHMDVSGREEVMVQEEYWFPHKIRGLVSQDLGLDELVV